MDNDITEQSGGLCGAPALPGASCYGLQTKPRNTNISTMACQVISMLWENTELVTPWSPFCLSEYGDLSSLSRRRKKEKVTWKT